MNKEELQIVKDTLIAELGCILSRKEINDTIKVIKKRTSNYDNRRI